MENFKTFPFQYFPNYLENNESIFEKLKKLEYRQDVIFVGKESIKRQERRKTIWLSNDPNLTFEYSGKIMSSNPIPLYLKPVLKKIKKDFGINFDGILINYYINGKTNMGYHSDPIDKWDNNFIIISLGSTRKFIFREKENKENKFEYIFNNGDLIYMYDDCQERYEHSVRKGNIENDERISLVFKKSK
tara:strand:+ start:277 stop:843 length:567 start_codon:yes stop_codon:yes gene_type:complete